MDSIDLLAREDEYKKLNKQLEKKTESLMKEIEHVMQKQDFFSEFSSQLSLNDSAKTRQKHYCDKAIPPPSATTPKSNMLKKRPINLDDKVNSGNTIPKMSGDFKDSPNPGGICDCCAGSKGNGDREFLCAFVSVNVKDKTLPPSFLKDNISVESVCKFLSSKVKLLQEQMDKLQVTLSKKASQCEAHLTQIAEFESERLVLLNKSNSMKTSTVELKAKCMAMQNKLEEKDRLYKDQRSETDRLSSEMKKVKTRNSCVEARSAAQELTIDELKQQLEVARRTEKEFKDSSRSLSASHQNAISRLEIQAKTLVARIDKQRALIDNLKKQNAIICTEGALKVLEREYCQFLAQDL